MHPLMAGFTSNPVVNYLDLSNGGAGCRCFDRLVFCGFDKKNSTTKRLVPGGAVGKGGSLGWNKLRRHIHQGARSLYSNVARKVATFKQDAIINSFNLLNASYNHNDIRHRLDQWTVIGLNQRQTRRRWLNLDEVLKHCRDNWLVQHKVVCVEIDLDGSFGSRPENQVIMYSGLDALVGIHGSQNVHGIWMPDGAYTLEILPYLVGSKVGKKSWGSWTQSTHGPTMNGAMYKNTKINHVGYALNITCVPNCTDWKHLQKCNGGARWDGRDFIVPLEMLDSFVRVFLLLPSGSATTTLPRQCREYDELAHSREFVLYNVNCIPDGTNRSNTTVQMGNRSNTTVQMGNISNTTTNLTTVQKQYYRQRQSFSHIDHR